MGSDALIDHRETLRNCNRHLHMHYKNISIFNQFQYLLHSMQLSDV